MAFLFALDSGREGEDVGILDKGMPLTALWGDGDDV